MSSQSDPRPRIKKIKRKRKKTSMLHQQRVNELRRMYGISDASEGSTNDIAIRISTRKDIREYRSQDHSPRHGDGNEVLVQRGRKLTSESLNEIDSIHPNGTRSSNVALPSLHEKSQKAKKHWNEVETEAIADDGAPKLPPISPPPGGNRGSNVRASKNESLSIGERELSDELSIPSIAGGTHTSKNEDPNEDSKQAEAKKGIEDSDDWEREVDDLVDWSKGLDLEDSMMIEEEPDEINGHHD